MNISRRGFMQSILAAAAAPAIVRADRIMRVSNNLIVPDNNIVIAEHAKPVLVPDWILEGHMSAPSWNDIKEGKCKRVRVNGVEYHIFSRDEYNAAYRGMVVS